MESVTEKFRRLVYDLRTARLETEQLSTWGEFVGVGATVRVPAQAGLRRIGFFGKDTSDGLVITFVENDQLVKGRLRYRLTGRHQVEVEYDEAARQMLLLVLLKSRELSMRHGHFRHRSAKGGVVAREEIVRLDDALRHAISQATICAQPGSNEKPTTLSQTGVRLPVRKFNKRLPNHSNAFRLWLAYRDMELPPERKLLTSALPYSIHHVKGGEYEGGVFIATAGRLNNFADTHIYPKGPLVRMHSACCFSEEGRQKEYVYKLEHDSAYSMALSEARYAFRPYSVRPNNSCDCRLQMEGSQWLIAMRGGIFADFYEQEGRGYGLLNKEEFFYRLYEEEGWDTAEVCERYGINPDIRVYDKFASWLRSLGLRHVQLIGNNPHKRQALERVGIEVTPVTLWLPTKENIDYLRVKRDRLGHDLPPDDELHKIKTRLSGNK
jgi:GTP cyclohydrolase II